MFDSFPGPQSPTPKHRRAVADASVALRELRRTLMEEHDLSLYRTLETTGRNPLRDAQDALDKAVRTPTGCPPTPTPLPSP